MSRNGKIEIGFPKDSNEKPTFKLKLNLNDGCGDAKSIDFEKGYYFHKKTKTFFGKIYWTKVSLCVHSSVYIFYQIYLSPLLDLYYFTRRNLKKQGKGVKSIFVRLMRLISGR